MILKSLRIVSNLNEHSSGINLTSKLDLTTIEAEPRLEGNRKSAIGPDFKKYFRVGWYS